jgi:hypothetical protein
MAVLFAFFENSRDQLVSLSNSAIGKNFPALVVYLWTRQQVARLSASNALTAESSHKR